MTTHYFGKCPKCGWKTRELYGSEVDDVKEGRYRCSGSCENSAVPNQPGTFPPKLSLEEVEQEDSDDGHNGR